MATPEYTPWVDHVYAALRWTEGSTRKLHELLEVEVIDNELRGRVMRTISWLEGARRQTFYALEKMGHSGEGEIKAKLDVSSIGDETKVKMLRLNASYLAELLNTSQGQGGYESLRKTMLSAVQVMREQAGEIEVRLGKGLEGPPEG